MKKDTATERAAMPKGNTSILDNRSLQSSYATIIPLLRPGMRVLDAGCGTGAISAGIAEAIGPEGHVTGIDSSIHLIRKGREDHAGLANLDLQEADLFTFAPAEKFDLIVSARVLQWLSNPAAALQHFKSLLKPGGYISILDYNHARLEWAPAPPESMRQFYQAFLHWRADAGMDNEIADHLPELFNSLGFTDVTVLPADEVYVKGEASFPDKAGIWTKVAELRGPQMVESGFLTEAQRLQVIAEYNEWVANEGTRMVMKLNEVRGRV
jgi:SAM-dependent methyltransferase